MNNDLILGTRALAKGRIRRVHAALGKRLECLGGSLWITQDGDRRDVLLAAGEAFEFDRSGDALVSALAGSHYLMLQACARLAPEGYWTGPLKASGNGSATTSMPSSRNASASSRDA